MTTSWRHTGTAVRKQCSSERRIVVAGALPDTGNLGVAALGESVLAQLADRLGDVRLTLLDQGRGLREAALDTGGRRLGYERLGVDLPPHVTGPGVWRRIGLVARVGSLGRSGTEHLGSARVILDASGGDSFTDLYGAWRFAAVVQPKQVALARGVPLVLLPQTYGPFRHVEAESLARRIASEAAQCWARDERSHDALRALLGEHFDPERHRAGVDLAFLLPPRRPAAHACAPLARWLEERDETPLVGFNASGLLYDRTEAERFGLRARYRRAVVDLLRRLLRESSARILLVPHVLTPPGHPESDEGVCRSILEQLGTAGRTRVALATGFDTAASVRWLVARTSWLCATRMHAAIAALASGVPAAGIAYSDKMRGVFETCGQGERVADARVLETEALVEHLWRSWRERETARASLAARLPRVLDRAREQMDRIAAVCDPEREGPPR